MTAQIRVIPLGASLDQATAELFRGEGALVQAGNGDHAKAGELRKRRGYRRISFTQDTHGDRGIDVLFVSVGTLGQELVIYGRDTVLGVHADTAIVDGASVTVRGPSMLGDVDSYDVLAIGVTE